MILYTITLRKLCTILGNHVPSRLFANHCLVGPTTLQSQTAGKEQQRQGRSYPKIDTWVLLWGYWMIHDKHSLGRRERWIRVLLLSGQSCVSSSLRFLLQTFAPSLLVCSRLCQPVARHLVAELPGQPDCQSRLYFLLIYGIYSLRLLVA